MTARRSPLANLDPARRAAIRALHEVRPAKNAVIALFVSMWVGAGTTAVLADHWMVRGAAYLAAGVALHAFGIFMHEAIHGNLFRSGRADRWAGLALGLPVLVSASAYRVTHLRHHRDTRGEHDPDEFTNYFKNPRLLEIAFYAWAVLGMVVFLVHVPLNAWRLGTVRDRRAIGLEYGVLALTLGTAIAAAAALEALPVLLHGWLIPLLVAFAIVNVRGWAEHMLTVPDNPFTHTRTVTSNRLVSFLLLNLNYHVEHHLFPGVPWYNVPKLHRLLEPEYRRHGTPIYRSYVRFLVDAARAGFHGLAPAPTARRGAP